MAPRVQVIAPTWIGDGVLALPALQVLRDAGCALEIWVRPGRERLYTDLDPGRAAFHKLPVRRMARFGGALRARGRGRADACLVLAPSLSAALVARILGARHRIGTSGAGRRMLLHPPYLTDDRSRHLALVDQDLGLEVLRRLQIPVPPAQAPAARAALPGLRAWPHLAARDEERSAAQQLLATAGLPPSPAPLVVAPGARYGPAKAYPLERFAAAVRVVQERLGGEHPLVLVGTAGDRERCGALARTLPGSADLAGRTSLGTLLGVLAQAAGVLANDSGTMHLAAALGTPVVGIFGSTNPAWTRPLGIRAGYVYHAVPCSPCYARTCARDFACMLQQPPEAPAEALLALMRAARATAPPGA